jgi:hypothetical protein
MRSHDAHGRGLSRSPSNRVGQPDERNREGGPPHHPPRQEAKPAGLGRTAGKASTAGMTDSGDGVTTSASGTSLDGSEPPTVGHLRPSQVRLNVVDETSRRRATNRSTTALAAETTPYLQRQDRS